MDNRPIGIFDSGMGGLTVRAEVARALPAESLLYFGDGKNVPYGGRSREEITGFVDSAVERLTERGVKMLIVACNAATGAAIDHLRSKYAFPIIGMEPAVKPAVLSSKSGVVGVLATAAALNGELYRATAARFGSEARIVEAVGEGFVELVESDREDTSEALETVRRIVEPMLDAGADRIVLGCTHYPYLAAQIRRVIEQWRERSGNVAGGRTGQARSDREAGNVYSEREFGRFGEVEIVDSAEAVARRAHKLLTEGDLHAESGNTPKHEFLSFASNDYIRRLEQKSRAVPEPRN